MAPAAPKSRRAWPVVALAVLAAVALIAALVVVLGGDDAAADEVFRQPVLTDGPDPFSDTVTTATTGALPAETNGSRTGSEPGLYGGTRDEASCDREAMVDFLAANPDKAAAWAQVQGIATDGIEAFLDELTPVVLRGDTRVTNHGYRDGVATPFQAVLQAGTAVMVDRTGVPRVRCACGNPLLPPIEAQSPRYSGDSWPGWDPERVQVVFVDDEADVLVLTDPVTGDQFERPAGTNGDADTDAIDQDLSGPWRLTLTTVSSVNLFDPGANDVEEAEVELSCDEDGTCTSPGGLTILEPLGGGLYAISGIGIADCVSEEDGTTFVADGLDVARAGEGMVTAQEGGRATEIQVSFTDTGTPNAAGVAGDCPEQTQHDLEGTLVR